MNILVVEDEVQLADTLAEILKRNKYNVDAVFDGDDGLEYARTGIYDCILLDIMLPVRSGTEIVRILRAEKNPTPIMLLTAKSEVEDKIHGLDCGADDYVAKPFGMMALVARIKAVLRRTEKQEAEEQVLTLGDLQVNPVRHVVHAAGETVNLTLKEFELLCLLMDNPGVVFTRDQLLNQIWGYSFDGESRTVDVHVRHLRQKLGECGKYIETVRGVGYRAGAEEL